jgi:hypothetical protein
MVIRQIEHFLNKWTKQDFDRILKGAEHGDEEHLRFAVILLLQSSRRLEKLTFVLIGLTFLLAVFTIKLITG